MSCLQSHLINDSLIEGYVGIVSFGNDLLQKERSVSTKINRRISKKLFFRWFDAYFKQLEITYKPYTQRLKSKVLSALISRRHQSIINRGSSLRKHINTLKFKAWLALLSNLTATREDKNVAETARRKYREKAYVDNPVRVNPIIDKILPGDPIEGSLYFD